MIFDLVIVIKINQAYAIFMKVNVVLTNYLIKSNARFQVSTKIKFEICACGFITSSTTEKDWFHMWYTKYK